MVLLMFVLAGGAATAWGQLDPNDPSPKFAHDVRNTCYSAVAGPFAKPALRWWGTLDDNPDPDAPDRHFRGPAIARLGPNNVRYVLIGTRDVNGDTETGRVLVFRFHPDANHWGPGQLEAQPVATLPVDYAVNSTPLVLPDDRVVIQTVHDVQVWDLSAPASPTRLWRAPLDSDASSPTCGFMLAEGGDTYLYLLGNPHEDPPNHSAMLYCISPDQETATVDLDTASAWSAELDPHNTCISTPAIGPISDDERNFVYVSLFTESEGTTDPHLFALLADGTPGQEKPRLWSHPINLTEGFIRKGTFASPSVHHAGATAYANQVVIGSDDSTLYAFYNDASPREVEGWPRRWYFNSGDYISGTAGLAPDGGIIFWNEHPSVYDLTDKGTYCDKNGWTQPLLEVNWYCSAPVLDSAGRFYAGTPGFANGGALAARVLAYSRPLADWGGPPPDPPDDPNWPLWTWGDAGDMPTSDPNHVPPVYVPRLGFGGPCAKDADGTLLCASYGYLFALRQSLGDFTGNGTTDIGDLVAMRVALFDPLRWEEQYGAVHGTSLLGVADADNDDAFTVSDISPLVEALAHGDNDSATPEDWTAFRAAVSSLYDSLGLEEQR